MREEENLFPSSQCTISGIDFFFSFFLSFFFFLFLEIFLTIFILTDLTYVSIFPKEREREREGFKVAHLNDAPFQTRASFLSLFSLSPSSLSPSRSLLSPSSLAIIHINRIIIVCYDVVSNTRLNTFSPLFSSFSFFLSLYFSLSQRQFLSLIIILEDEHSHIYYHWYPW